MSLTRPRLLGRVNNRWRQQTLIGSSGYMVLQGDDDGHEGRDGRRRGLPSEASGGRYATHCWALTRPLGRLGRHRLVSGGAIAQQWLVQELREHLVGHHLLRRAREPRPLRLPLLLRLLLLLLPLPLLLLLRGPVATGANGMRRRALRRRRATATRTGGLRRVDGAARAGDFGHYVECTGRTTGVQAVGSAVATSSGHSRGAGQQKRGRDGAERHRFLYKTVGLELGSPV